MFTEHDAREFQKRSRLRGDYQVYALRELVVFLEDKHNRLPWRRLRERWALRAMYRGVNLLVKHLARRVFNK